MRSWTSATARSSISATRPARATGIRSTPDRRYRNPKHAGQTSLVYVYVEDVDAHCARAREAGAKIVEEPNDQEYGDRRYTADDPEGHQWCFAQQIGR
jgi:uncharacterized glyoxalase superfamily protein PhnB